MTRDGTEPMPDEEEHCTVVEVSQDEVDTCVKMLPKIETLVCRGRDGCEDILMGRWCGSGKVNMWVW